MLLLTCVAAAVAAGGTPGAPKERTTASGGPSLRSGVLLAKRYIARRYHISGIYSVRADRSKRNSSFALVDGYFRRPRRQPNLWVVYLRVRDGRWRVHYAGIGSKAIEPKTKVPCDIWPPFAEPTC